MQGNLIGRGVVEFCDGGPPVRTTLEGFCYFVSFTLNDATIKIGLLNFDYIFQFILLYQIMQWYINLALTYGDNLLNYYCLAILLQIWKFCA